MTTLYVMVAEAENSNGTETRLFFTRQAAYEAGCEMIDGFHHADDDEKAIYKQRLDKDGFCEGYNNDTVTIREQVVEGGADLHDQLVPDRRLKLPWTAQPYGSADMRDQGGRFNIPEIHCDIHVCYNGSGGEPKMFQTVEEVQAIVPFILTAANNFHDMVAAMQEAAGAIDSLSTQIEQMKGMFPDDDGTIEAALEDGLCADQIIHVTLGKVKEGLK